MQKNAKILAKANKPVRWTTPTGLVVQQAYSNPNEQRVYTVLGVGRARKRWDTRYWVAGEGLRVTKQTHGVAPNIIHSFDAAHLMLSVVEAPAHMCFSVIHDSFGVHACDMSAFLRGVQDQFVEIYSKDWFSYLQADFIASQNGEDLGLVPPPERGDFNIREVCSAPFFFS